MSSVRGTDQIGPFSSASGHVFIYVNCYGTGIVTVELVGSATITQQCLTDANDPGTRNKIQALTSEEIVVRGTAENSNLWAIAVTDTE